MDQDLGTPIASTETVSEPPKSRSTLIIVLVVVLIVLCCCCAGSAIAGGWWMWENGDDLFNITRFIPLVAAA